MNGGERQIRDLLAVSAEKRSVQLDGVSISHDTKKDLSAVHNSGAPLLSIATLLYNIVIAVDNYDLSRSR